MTYTIYMNVHKFCVLQRYSTRVLLFIFEDVLFVRLFCSSDDIDTNNIDLYHQYHRVWNEDFSTIWVAANLW